MLVRDERNREFPAFICDKFGQQYPLEVAIETSYTVVLIFRCNGQNGGQLNLTDFHPVLWIADLFIRDNLFKTSTDGLRRFLGLWGFESKKLSLRGRGLGSALLKVAKEFGAKGCFDRIEGRLVPEDVGRTPFLREFYMNAGFQIVRKEGQEKILCLLNSSFP